MQQLIEQLEEQKKAIPVEAYQKGLEYAIQAAKTKLEKEREQIQTAYYDGGDDVCPNGKAGGIMAEQYYKETYG